MIVHRKLYLLVVIVGLIVNLSADADPPRTFREGLVDKGDWS